MTRRMSLWMLAACGVLTMGCSSHLLFVEEGHIGLKAKFESNSPTPAQVTLGSHRGMMAVVPQQSKDASPRTQPPTVTASIDDDKHKILTIEHDPDELMSMYSTFCANIGFNDPVEVHHFLATGTAAVTLLSNQELLRDLTKELDRSACKAPPKDEEKGPKGGEE